MAHEDFWSALILLLLVIDPVGSVGLYLGLVRELPRRRRVRVTLRESALAYVVLLAFMLGGQGFLQLLGLRQASLEVAGGVILLLVAVRMIFTGGAEIFGELGSGEPLLFPLAVPLLAGPSALATVLLLASGQPQRLGTWVAALSAAVACSAGVLLAAEALLQRVGDAVLRAVEKLMGMIVAAIAVNMLLGGVHRYFFG